MGHSSSSSESEYDKAKKKYEESISQYTGNSGYLNSLKMAKEGSKQQAKSATSGAVTSAQTAARQSGMSKAQSAMLGSQKAANTYQDTFNNAFNTQQANAVTMGNNELQARNQQMGNAYNKINQDDQRAYQGASLALSGLGTAASVFSDERLKHYKEVTRKVELKDPDIVQKLKIEVRKNG